MRNVGRSAAWDLVRRTTSEQGLPERVRDIGVLSEVARILEAAQLPEAGAVAS
jgi:hypothetical protein